MKRELTCIACPLGCSLVVTLEGKSVLSVEGNTCPRGKEYAINECTAPKRTVTTIVRCENGELISVKTSKPIPKEKVFEAMEIINSTVARLPLTVGDVIISDLFGSDVVATQCKEI
jgi:CxxC motif-containing protein